MATPSSILTAPAGSGVGEHLRSRPHRDSGRRVLVTLVVLVPFVLIAGYIAMVFVMNPTEDDRGYLHALHRDDPTVFLDHTDQQMLSIGHEICRMIQDPKGPSDFSYAGDVAGAAYQYLCLD